MNNEYENDPIENKRKTNVFTKFMLILVVIIIAVFSVITYFINSFTRYANVDYIEFNNEQIPTLYKYTQYDDVFITKKNSNLLIDGVRGSYVVIFYNNAIPMEYKNDYAEKLNDLGYEYIKYNGTEFYVKNIENNTKFIYIMLADLQIKYGICTSGCYEDILK